MQQYQLVSLIPARGGSERIPRKNIKMLAGKPMIAWSIEASLKSKYVNRTFVSTEDKEIKEVAIRYGAEVIDRPKKYATDNGYELLGVLQHFKETLWDKGYYPDYLAFLYPTCPLRTAEEIDGTYELMIKENSPMARTAIKWYKAGSAEDYFEKDDCGNWFRPVGYNCVQRHLINQRKLFHKDRYLPTDNVVITCFRTTLVYHDVHYQDLVLFIIDEKNWVDVNTTFDFKVAEMLLEERIRGGDKNG